MTQNTKRTRIAVDYENNAEAWWGAAGDAYATCPDSCLPLLRDMNTDDVTVSADDAAAFRAWGASLPGWSDGPAHAREPFVFHDAE